MRIKYTLPGFQPGRTMGPGVSELQNASFSSRLQRLKHSEAPGWKAVLRLDRTLADAGTIDPPPRPETLEANDAASERRCLRNLVNRDSGTTDSRVTAMLELLRDYQTMEDSIVARYLAETQG
jgi:hypothetical protein